MTAIVKGAKKGSDKAKQPAIAPDSAQSKTFINILYGLAEGEVEGPANGNQSILLEGTPLQDANGNSNFTNVKVDFRKGTNDQEYIEGFPSVDNEAAVGVELKSDTPWVRSFNNIDLDAIRVRLKWGPLRKQDATSGDVNGLTIEYAIDLQTDGGSWTEVLKTKISDKTSANYERAHRIDLPKADNGWLLRVRRITPNSTSEYISDKMYIEAVTEVVDVKLRYPNTALLGLRYDAETFSNVAKVAVDMKGTLILVPTNYEPQTRQYSGMWDGTFKRAYTNNPAWIYYDLCTNDRYGLGDRLTPLMIDKWSLYRLSQYCDQTVPDGMGGQEPRFTCNVYLQSSEDAFSILMKLAGIFRAMAFWDGNSINCDADIPQDTFFTYSRANVIDGAFEYAGTRARDRHNVVKIAWDNPANHYKTEYEFVRDEQAIAESGQIRILELDAWGCTSRGQAQRAGLWALKSEQKETRTVSFKVGLDGHIPLPGRVIEIADELFAGRANGGRVSKISSDLKEITLDRDNVVVKAGDRLVINGENGKAQARIVKAIAGRTVTVTLPFEEKTIAVQNVWVLDAQDLATMKFRVVSITQDEKHQFSITALQYNPQKFDEIDNGAFFEDVPISIVNPLIQEPVKDVLITSDSRVDQGINIVTMIVSWAQAKGAVKYLIEWRKDDGSWVRLPITGNNSVEVPNVYSGQYQARVTAISAFEIASLPATSNLTEIKGKEGLPPKLAFIRATGILFGMQLDWGFPQVGANDTAYTEVQVSPDGATNIAQLGLFAYPTTTNTIQGLQPNLRQFYRGRLIDRIGNEGPWSDWVNGITIADPESVLDLISGHIGESDLAKELQGKIEDSIKNSEAAQQAASNAQEAVTVVQTIAENANASAAEANRAASEAQQTASNAHISATNAAAEASKVASDLTTSTNQLNQKIAEESNTRTAVVSQLNDGITAETTQRKSEDLALLTNIETYKASTNGTLSSLQTQVSTNATDISSNASKITSLDSRLTTNEGKTGDAINAAATAQQIANTAVDQASAAANSVTALRSDLSGGKGKNAIIALYSDAQVLAFDVVTSAATCALAASTMRVKGKAYDITFTSANGAVYFGTTSAAYAVNRAAATVRGGKKYLLSMYAKSQDASKVVDFYVTVRWFRRLADNSIVTTDVSLSSQVSGTTRITPTTAGQVITCKSVTAPSDAFAMSFWVTGNNLYNVAGSRLLLDMLMFEESVGDDKSASMWVAGAPDLSAIQSSLDANATAITNLTTRVANDEGTITSHSQSITQLNNSITTINNSLSSKADVSAINSLDTKVTNIDGRVTTNTNAVTSLQGQVNTVENGLSKKADASVLNNYYTKTEVDSATAGQINSFNSSLVIGGRNLVRNTGSVREGWGWLFVEPLVEALIGQYTISFDIENLDGTLTGSGVGFRNPNGDFHYFWYPDSTTGHKSVTMNLDSTGFVHFGIWFNNTVRLKNVKVEKGVKDTGWSPAPEDVKASIDLNASAIQTTQTNVSNIDGRLSTATDSITSLNSRMSSAESGITGANNAINTLSTRISDAEGKLTSQSNSVTQLSDQIGNTKSYSIVTFRNGSAVGLPKDGGIHSYKGKINGFGRGLNLIVFNNGDVSSVQAFDTYGDMATACTNLNNAIQALASGTYFAIVGTDNIGSVSIHATADTLRTTLLACGASRSYLNTWVGNSLPIFVGRKDLDAGNGILAMFDSSVMNQWIEYPLTFVNGAPVGMGDSRAITTQLDANATAISSLSNKVTQQGNDITSQSNAITSLNNSLSVSGKAGANLLIKSNVAGTYNGVGYPHVTYELGEEWEVGTKYTLLWCAEHKRGAGDTNSSLWAYAGGGMQNVQGVENTNGKVINKVTFTKDGVATSKYIHFFMINRPTADKNSIGTVYWAVLVKGDLITTDSWVPSSYDFIADSRVNSSALNSLDSKVTNIDGRVTSNSNAITSLNSRIATAEGNITSNANAIANTYTKAQADEATAGQINSFNSSLIIGGRNLVRNTGGVREGWAWLFIESLVEPLVGNYTVSFDIENLDGNITGSGVGFRNPNGDFHYFWYPDSTTGHKSVTMNLDSTGFVHFGIWFNNTVRLKNVKVEKGVKDTGWSPAPEDVKAGIDANASAINGLSSRVTATEGNITSQSSSITSLSNQIGNTKSYSIVTFKNGSAASSMPKDGGIHSYKGKISRFGRGLNLIVFNNGDVASCTAYDTYGDIYGGCNALYYAVNALASGTYFAIVGNDNIRDVGVLNPDTPLRALMLACGASDKYFRSWNWTSLPIFIGRKDVDAGNGILGMFDSSLPNQWIEYPLVFVNGAPVGMGDSRAVTAQIDANAAAISSLSNTVTQQGNDIVSHSNSLTSLNNSISGIYKEIQLSDTRNDNQPPAWYWQNHGLKIVREFKLTSVLGLSGLMPDLYVTLETQVPWTDPSGGQIIQIARGSSSAFTAERRSADYNSWFPWSQDIIGLKNGLNNKADASAVTSLDSKVNVIDGKVSSQASSITELQTTVGGHSSSIQQVTESVNGVRAQQYLKMDVNGHISGHGSMNDGTTSSFIFNYDTIQFGAPSNISGVSPKSLMTLQSTPITLPNGTVIPPGLYVDTGSFGYINADRIWAKDLSVISADMGTIKVKNANIDDGAISTLKIQDEAVTVPIGVTFPANSNIPDFDNQLVDETSINAWFSWSSGKIANINMARTGGKALIGGGLMLKQFAVAASINGNTSRSDFASLISLIVGVYRNGYEIARHYFAPSGTQNNILYFSGSYTLPPTIDSAFTGNAEYSLKVAIGRNSTSFTNVKASFYKDGSNLNALPFELTSRTLTIIELKK
ncbi:TPA: hypothetical protein MW252_002250 [Acinetobacter nosocomialis]|nr:hypothetical protein [Acinetobacter nosocomialis]